MRKALLIVTLLCLQSGVTEAANWRAEAVQIILKYGREFIQINPRYTAAYVNRGMAYNQKKDFNREFQDWDAAFSLDPKFACSELLGSRLPLSVYLQSRGCSAR